ncbi:Gfo/Idh/MocA family protein [Mahella australiensis]|uniref:Oxidoreductase domain protein n=1 Tax=Mahella australiensis (strain DSM 15567 / CIP 107919 / 50-1 BON) TaxID=697281 RepID=F4A0S4_MAHA5|nr:Gfo/Idh/MocA family oxidoreductase [Mahella australiensis]AEE96970.1 oxidoreductase domain protein [Mahella australiensis 50-1 BON]
MLKIGIAGARGLSTIAGFNAIDGVKVEALCDLNEDLLREQAAKYSIPKTYRVFDDMLESDIDAVVVATPMQYHVPQTVAALEAGKHVLSEVTAGVSIDELWWLIECVEKYNKVYMMAENYCYIPENQLIKSMVNKGLFGDLYFGEGEYLHELKGLATYPNGKTSWRRFWQLGRRGMFYPTHSLGPIMQWFGDDHIKSVICVGSGWHTAPEFAQEDTSITLCQMESGRLIKLRLDCISERPHNLAYYSLQGTNGCYEAPRGMGDDHKIWLKGMDDSTDKAKWRPLREFYDYLPDRYKNVTEEQKSSGHWGGDYFVVQDFVDAIVNGDKPAIDVYDACEWTAVAFLSELSVMNGGKVIDMPKFRANLSNQNKILKI